MNLGFSTGHFAEAEELCRAGLREQPEDAGLLAMLAEIRRARGDAAGAAVLFDQILQKQPRNTGALRGRATLYEEAGQPEKAIPLLREVLRLDPRSRRTAGYQLSIDLERVGRTDEAQNVLREVRRLQDVEVFRGAIETQPDNLDLQVRLAKLLLAEGFTQDGLELLDAVLKRDPNFPPAQQALAAHRRQAEGPP
jgi:predicted Zn-dependent protease